MGHWKEEAHRYVRGRLLSLLLRIFRDHSLSLTRREDFLGSFIVVGSFSIFSVPFSLVLFRLFWLWLESLSCSWSWFDNSCPEIYHCVHLRTTLHGSWSWRREPKWPLVSTFYFFQRRLWSDNNTSSLWRFYQVYGAFSCAIPFLSATVHRVTLMMVWMRIFENWCVFVKIVKQNVNTNCNY